MSTLSSVPIAIISKWKPNLPLRITAGSTRSYLFDVPMKKRFARKLRSSIIDMNMAVARSVVPVEVSDPLNPNNESISSMMTRCYLSSALPSA